MLGSRFQWIPGYNDDVEAIVSQYLTKCSSNHTGTSGDQYGSHSVAKLQKFPL
jgi:hypothetical protein